MLFHWGAPDSGPGVRGPAAGSDELLGGSAAVGVEVGVKAKGSSVCVLDGTLVETADPEAETADPDAETADPEVEPGDVEAEPGNPEVEPGDVEAETGDGEAEPGDPEAEPGDPEAEPGDGEAESGDPEAGGPADGACDQESSGMLAESSEGSADGESASTWGSGPGPADQPVGLGLVVCAGVGSCGSVQTTGPSATYHTSLCRLSSFSGLSTKEDIQIKLSTAAAQNLKLDGNSHMFKDPDSRFFGPIDRSVQETEQIIKEKTVLT